jgi:hypothetical protein
MKILNVQPAWPKLLSRSGVLLASAVLLLPLFALADSLTATGDVYFVVQRSQPNLNPGGAGFISPTTPGVSHTSFQPSTAPGGDLKLSGNDGATASVPLGTNEQFSATAAASVFADASYGILKASVEASSVVSPLKYEAPFTAIGANHYYPASYAIATAGFTDSIHVYDPSVPLGTVVNVKISENLNETQSVGCEAFYGGYCNGDPTGALIGVLFASSLGNTVIKGIEQEYQTYAIAKAVNGETATLTSYLSVITGSYAGDFDATAGDTQASQDNFVDASHTFYTNVDPVTAGLQISSGSGYNYATGASQGPSASAVPEASTSSLYVAGGLLLIGIGRRKSRQGGACRRFIGSI